MHQAIDAEPAWDATNRIVFTSTRGGNSKIYAMDPNGAALVPLTNSGTGYDLSPDW
jgi:Tol biopolymer transport system component